jgi:hypothetical protein
MTNREPCWHALLVFGLLGILMGTRTYYFAEQFDQEPQLFFAAQFSTQKDICYITAKNHQPTQGSAGCACVFAVPGLLVFAFGLWDLRRWCR